MKLISIINAWADTVELLPACLDNHLQFADAVMVVSGVMSNHGNKNNAVPEFIKKFSPNPRIYYENFEPFMKYAPQINETAKRNYGINAALDKNKFTHFLMADADEFYHPNEMNELKTHFEDPSLNGYVHPLKVYIGHATLCTDDHTLVAGIHKLNHNVTCGNFNRYPYAYDQEGKAHIDPTRRLSFTTGIRMSKIYMHHYSYVRKNIELKIENSSANLRRSRDVIHEDITNAKPGYTSKLYHRELKECPNYFNIGI